MVTLAEYQNKEDKEWLRVEELKNNIPDLAEDKFNALPVLYTTPAAIYQAAYIEDAISYMTTPEWQEIARALRGNKDTRLAGQLLDKALRRVCLKLASEEIEDQL